MSSDRLFRKPPRQKKSESYARDCRYAFGNSPHAARNAVPRRKQQRSQQERSAARQALGGVAAATDETRVDAMLARVAVSRARAWRKWPDRPLGEVLREKGRMQRK